jgi:hypothetical protein
MTSRDFCFWLQGHFEISGASALSAEQTEVVKKHLSLVFKHEIDPSMGPPSHQDALDALHKPNRPGHMLRC